MTLDELTIGDAKQLACMFGGKAVEFCTKPYKIGENYLIRTVTMIQVGRLEWVGDKEIVLSSASWVADTGRFNEAIKTGNLNEVEPFTDDVIVGRGSIIDATIWTHKLPKEAK